MIEASDVFEYFMCPYKVYNKHNRDKSLMLPFSDFSKKLMEAGREHEKEVISKLKVSRPFYKWGDFSKGFLETVKLMQIGADYIYQGVLKDRNYLGIPDLLIKEKGKSRFGDYHYVAADIKSSAKSKEEQIMQVKFYNMLLEKAQGFDAGKGILILKENSETVDLTQIEDKFNSALTKIDLMCKGLEYGMHIDGVCKDCPWREVCIPLAKKKKDVSLIYGLSRPMHYKLIENEILTLNNLIKANTSKVAKLTEATEETVEKWKNYARVIISGKAKISKINLPKTKNHICFDIETTEDGKLYLIGIWHKKKFRYFLSGDNEKKIINDFIEYLLGLKDYILYHYGPYEKSMFRQLFDKYKIDDSIRNDINSKMVDLYQIVKKNAVLPLTSYGLKEIAKYFKFKWRSTDASGGNSMLWFDEWNKNKDKKVLKKILNYNEDDVKATYIVLKKLSKGKV